MAPTFSKYLSKNTAYVSVGLTASALWLISKKYSKQQRARNKRRTEEVKYTIAQKHPEKVKARVDFAFFKQLLQIVKIVIPRWNSSEAGYVAMVAAIMVVRTLCDIWVLNATANIESTLVLGHKALFAQHMLTYMAAVPIISVINNLLKFALGQLKIGMRKNLSLHLYKGYLKKQTYYRVSNLDSRIPNVDHLLTADVEKFCHGLAELYSNISKPVLDISIFSYKISRNLSSLPPAVMLAYFAVSGVLLTYLRRSTGRFTAREQKLEGEYRHINARIITHAEEIAFYNGNAREKLTLLASFNKLIEHIRTFLRFRAVLGFLDSIIAKYSASVVGYLTFSIPFLYAGYGMETLEIADRSKIYYEYGQMLIKLAQAVGRLVLSGRELTRLAGYTFRITQLQKVLKDVSGGNYVRTMVEGSNTLCLNAGIIIIQDNIIKFEKVPIVTPNGDVLIKELTIEIRSGMNVLVCGPNGAGKSSVFRILGELWPLFGGELTKPGAGKLFYVPQKPYMTLGNLRDQITYPHSAIEAKACKRTDEELKQYLQLVQLEYLLDRKGELNAVADWLDILSGGEKQRIAMARLFYHAPQFAILDECTSSVAIDVEDVMYSYCREVGITLLTVTHRKSLWKHHEFALYLDGRGGYTFNYIDESMEQFGS